jgi:DNA-binding MarR family transcriptional regulator
MKLPLRSRILTLMANNEVLSDEEVFKILQSEYGSERQYKRSTVLHHLHSMQAAGLLSEPDVLMDEKGELIETFKITDLGTSRLQLLPKNWETK